MKNIFLIFILLIMASVSNATDKNSFVWVDDENYWPAIYRGKDGKPAGIFNDVLTEVFVRLGIPLKKAVYPWGRVQKIVKDGEADGMVTIYTKARQALYVATEPVWNINETLFFRRDNPKACEILKIHSFDDMRNLTIVDMIGSGWTEEKCKEHGIKHVIWVPSVDTAFNMLAKGRADVFIMFDLNGYSTLSKKRANKGALLEGYQNIITISPEFSSLPFRLLIRKNSPFAKKIDDINRVLKKMKNDGTYQHIKEKYIAITQAL